MIDMKRQKTLYINSRKEWRLWLGKNFEKEKEIWLVYPKKSSGKWRIHYNDAVEEALCFGWIDSNVKTIDKENIAQRFSQRKPNSSYSQTNRERLKWLLKEKMVHPSIKPAVEKILKEKYVYPKDIINSIKSDTIAWKNYQKFSLPYKKIRIAYINSARARPDEFKKRLKYFINKTRENKQFGFGGIEKYFKI
jgi:uncharacterized protein YdeI (YjbR/CyaY-like superfamily)